MDLLSGNSVNVSPGSPHFDIYTNKCDYFSLGTKDGYDVWIEGEIVAGAHGPEYIFNGRLFDAKGGKATVIDSFPKSDPPAGWSKEPHMDGSGYILKDAQNETVFGYRIENDVCKVELGLHKADGTVAAASGQGGMLLNIRPAIFGRGGMVFGNSEPGDPNILPGLPNNKMT